MMVAEEGVAGVVGASGWEPAEEVGVVELVSLVVLN